MDVSFAARRALESQVRTKQTTISNLKKEEVVYNERKMSPGNLITGGARKKEQAARLEQENLAIEAILNELVIPKPETLASQP